jgi:hypothetical protein
MGPIGAVASEARKTVAAYRAFMREVIIAMVAGVNMIGLLQTIDPVCGTDGVEMGVAGGTGGVFFP